MAEVHTLLLLYGKEEVQNIFSCLLDDSLESETERHLQLSILLDYGVDVKVNGDCEFAEGVEIGKL